MNKQCQQQNIRLKDLIQYPQEENLGPALRLAQQIGDEQNFKSYQSSSPARSSQNDNMAFDPDPYRQNISNRLIETMLDDQQQNQTKLRIYQPNYLYTQNNSNMQSMQYTNIEQTQLQKSGDLSLSQSFLTHHQQETVRNRTLGGGVRVSGDGPFSSTNNELYGQSGGEMRLGKDCEEGGLAFRNDQTWLSPLDGEDRDDEERGKSDSQFERMTEEEQEVAGHFDEEDLGLLQIHEGQESCHQYSLKGSIISNQVQNSGGEPEKNSAAVQNYESNPQTREIAKRPSEISQNSRNLSRVTMKQNLIQNVSNQNSGNNERQGSISKQDKSKVNNTLSNVFHFDINQFDDQPHSLMHNSTHYIPGIGNESPLEQPSGQLDPLLESRPMQLEDLAPGAHNQLVSQIETVEQRKARRNKSQRRINSQKITHAQESQDAQLRQAVTVLEARIPDVIEQSGQSRQSAKGELDRSRSCTEQQYWTGSIQAQQSVSKANAKNQYNSVKKLKRLQSSMKKDLGMNQTQCSHPRPFKSPNYSEMNRKAPGSNMHRYQAQNTSTTSQRSRVFHKKSMSIGEPSLTKSKAKLGIEAARLANLERNQTLSSNLPANFESIQKKYVSMLKSYESYRPGQRKKSEVKPLEEEMQHQDEECNVSDGEIEEGIEVKERLQNETTSVTGIQNTANYSHLHLHQLSQTSHMEDGAGPKTELKARDPSIGSAKPLETALGSAVKPPISSQSVFYKQRRSKNQSMFIGSGFDITQQLNFNETQGGLQLNNPIPTQELSVGDYGNTQSKSRFNNTQQLQYQVLEQSQLINISTKQVAGCEEQDPQPKPAKSPSKATANERLFALSKQNHIKRFQLYQKYNPEDSFDIAKLAMNLGQSMQIPQVEPEPLQAATSTFQERKRSAQCNPNWRSESKLKVDKPGQARGPRQRKGSAVAFGTSGSRQMFPTESKKSRDMERAAELLHLNDSDIPDFDLMQLVEAGYNQKQTHSRKMSVCASNEKYNELVAKKIQTQEKLAQVRREKILKQENAIKENLNHRFSRKVSKSRELEVVERFQNYGNEMSQKKDIKKRQLEHEQDQMLKSMFKPKINQNYRSFIQASNSKEAGSLMNRSVVESGKASHMSQYCSSQAKPLERSFQVHPQLHVQIPENQSEKREDISALQHQSQVTVLLKNDAIVKKENYQQYQQDASRFNAQISLISANQSDILDADSEQFEQLEAYLDKNDKGDRIGSGLLSPAHDGIKTAAPVFNIGAQALLHQNSTHTAGNSKVKSPVPLLDLQNLKGHQMHAMKENETQQKPEQMLDLANPSIVYSDGGDPQTILQKIQEKNQTMGTLQQQQQSSAHPSSHVSQSLVEFNIAEVDQHCLTNQNELNVEKLIEEEKPLNQEQGEQYKSFQSTQLPQNAHKYGQKSFVMNDTIEKQIITSPAENQRSSTVDDEEFDDDIGPDELDTVNLCGSPKLYEMKFSQHQASGQILRKQGTSENTYPGNTNMHTPLLNLNKKDSSPFELRKTKCENETSHSNVSNMGTLEQKLESLENLPGHQYLPQQKTQHKMPFGQNDLIRNNASQRIPQRAHIGDTFKNATQQRVQTGFLKQFLNDTAQKS